MNNDLMFSSKNQCWETPQNLFDRLNAEFHFTLDVCATPETAKCKEYFTLEINGLEQPWNGVCWMNPPHGRNICEWVKKAHVESTWGNTIVCLIPSRTDTKYWHYYCMKATEIRFIKGRLKFGKATNSAPFPSAIVIFGKGNGELKISTYESVKP